jgi:hypothetical protein
MVDMESTRFDMVKLYHKNTLFHKYCQEIDPVHAFNDQSVILKIEFFFSSPASMELPLFEKEGQGEILWTICVFTSRMDFFFMKGTFNQIHTCPK